MKKIKKLILLSGLVFILVNLSGCHFTNSDKINSNSCKTNSSNIKSKYEKGEKITLLTHHMKGMYKASGTIDSITKTKYYSINYHPTNDPNKLIKNHKWVIENELEGERPLKKGEKVTVLARHMPGMYGAKATIESVHDGYVYSVNYYPTNRPNKLITDHKWLAEDEIKPKTDK